MLGMSHFPIYSYSFSEALALNLIPNKDFFQLSGYNANVTNVEELLWEYSDVYNPIPSAQTVRLSSTSANDTLLGTGARTVRISGLDALYNEISETLNLNGNTAVSSVNAYRRINKIEVLTAGALGYNAGRIFVGIGTVSGGGINNNPQITIAANESVSHIAYYTVPNNRRLIIMKIYYNGGRSIQPFRFRLWKRSPSGLQTVVHTSVTRDNDYQAFETAYFFEEGDDLYVTAFSIGGNTAQPTSCLLQGALLNV
jgi:hypothetical protein